MLKGFVLACALAALLLPAAASAASPTVNSWGVRVGASNDPDQLAFGGQLHLGEIAPNLTFDPNLELGIGDDVTTVQPNFDLQYHFHTNTVWEPYAGGGLGLAFYSWDAPGPGLDDSSTEVGANLIIGAEAPTRSGNRFFGELRLGIGDLPDLKVMVGWNFKM